MPALKRRAAAGIPQKELLARLGQYCYAFAHGTQSLRITRYTLMLFNEKYIPCITKAYDLEQQGAAEPWEKRSPLILDLMAAVGRLAAQYATSDGRMTISRDDLKRAAKKVQRLIPVPGIDCPLIGDW